MTQLADVPSAKARLATDEVFSKNLTLQADAPPSSLIAEGEGEYGSLRCALVISSFAEEKIVLERLARVMRGPGQKRSEVSNVSSMDSDSAVPEGGHCQCPWHSTVPLIHTVYRVAHLLADLGWVDSDLRSSQAGGLLLQLSTSQAG